MTQGVSLINRWIDKYGIDYSRDPRKIKAQEKLFFIVLFGLVLFLWITLPLISYGFVFMFESFTFETTNWPIWTKGLVAILWYYGIPGLIIYMLYLVREAYYVQHEEKSK